MTATDDLATSWEQVADAHGPDDMVTLCDVYRSHAAAVRDLTGQPMVHTVAELDALPAGAYILTAYTFDRDQEPLILRRGPDWGLTDRHALYWWTTDGGDQIGALDRVDDTEHLVLPATVLWAPEATS